MKVSADLPTYLLLEHSVLNKTQKRVDGRLGLKRTKLNTGVSVETPKHFHVSYVPVLDKSAKNLEISPNHGDSVRFLNRLKEKSVFCKKTFQYSDMKSQKFDYDNVGFGKALDISRGHTPLERGSASYYCQYSRFLHTGFGKRREMFTVEASQPRVNRLNSKRLTLLRSQVKKERKKSNISTINEEVASISAGKISMISKPYSNKPRITKSQTPDKLNCLKELDDFEKNLYKFQI